MQGTKEQSVSEGGGAALASEEATKKARARRQMVLNFPMVFCQVFRLGQVVDGLQPMAETNDAAPATL